MAANGVTSLSTTTNAVDYPTACHIEVEPDMGPDLDGVAADVAGTADSGEAIFIDPAILSSGGIGDFIADFAQSQDTLDLSDLLASLGNSPPVTDAAPEPVNQTTDASAGSGAGETFVDVASLTGISIAISILYDESHHSQATNVT